MKKDYDPEELLAEVVSGIPIEARTVISIKVRQALRRKRAKGERVGGIPFGSQLGPDGKTLEPNEDELRVLRIMRARRRDGITYRGIAAELTANGYRSRAGGAWSRQSVCELLRRHG